MEDLFEFASRNKLRFDTPQGPASVEDLWDLPLEVKKNNPAKANLANLDDIAVNLNEEIQKAGNTSFVRRVTGPGKILKAKFEILLYIIGVKQTENEASVSAQANAARKQQLQAVLASKQESALANKTEEELLAEIAAL